jgi:hypothetical protein
MKPFAFFLLTAAMGLAPKLEAQVITAVDCDLMNLVCNVCSQTGMINLYHPGGYLTFPTTENVMDWTFTDSQGNVLHQETLVDNNFVSFSFDLDLTDTMYVSVLLTNDSAVLNGGPVACLIEDYLVWEVTEIVPGFPQGAWTLGGSLGVDVSETSTGGCMYPLACNYDADATFDDGSCTFPPESCAWPDAWAAGCTYADADNYDASAAVDDGSCTWTPCNTCPGDINGDDAVTVSDVLAMLGVFGTTCTEPPFSLIGRWHPEGFETNTLYEFTETLRYTIYSGDGSFGSIDEAIPGPNPWHMEGDTVVIDLFFGNELRGLLEPSCGGQKATISPGGGLFPTVLHREGVDPADCE